MHRQLKLPLRSLALLGLAVAPDAASGAPLLQANTVAEWQVSPVEGENLNAFELLCALPCGEGGVAGGQLTRAYVSRVSYDVQQIPIGDVPASQNLQNCGNSGPQQGNSSVVVDSGDEDYSYAPLTQTVRVTDIGTGTPMSLPYNYVRSMGMQQVTSPAQPGGSPVLAVSTDNFANDANYDSQFSGQTMDDFTFEPGNHKKFFNHFYMSSASDSIPSNLQAVNSESRSACDVSHVLSYVRTDDEDTVRIAFSWTIRSAELSPEDIQKHVHAKLDPTTNVITLAMRHQKYMEVVMGVANTTDVTHPGVLPLFSWSSQVLCTDVSDPMDISSATYTKASEVNASEYTPRMKAWLETKDPPYGSNVSNLNEQGDTPDEDFRQNWLIQNDHLPWVKHPDMSEDAGITINVFVEGLPTRAECPVLVFDPTVHKTEAPNAKVFHHEHEDHHDEHEDHHEAEELAAGGVTDAPAPGTTISGNDNFVSGGVTDAPAYVVALALAMGLGAAP